MKKLLFFLIATGMLFIPSWNPTTSSSYAGNGEQDEAQTTCIDVYEFTMKLNVPQVLNNSTSLGERKYKSQTIKGDMYVKWMSDGTFEIEIANAVNKSFKVGGNPVTYTSYDPDLLYHRFNWIGSNKKELFKTPTLCFSIALEPSYAKKLVNEDNSFYLLLSGKGTSSLSYVQGCRVAKKFKGYVTGTQGCSCFDYGHKSPTRVGSSCGPSDRVDDAVATFGTWTAKWNKRYNCK
jgi:hypothetical protein